MNLFTNYFNEVQMLMKRILDEEGDAIRRGATLMADVLEQNRLVHVFGTGGHSAMGAEELFFRAGGLVPINAILDEGVLLAHGALRSMLVERTPGYGNAVLNYHNLGSGDVLIIVNAYGVNACTIDAALEGRKRGCSTIGVTSVALQRELPDDHPARHPTSKNLCDLVDVTVDCKVPMGDALLQVPGVTQRVGSCSTYLNALALNLLSLSTVEMLAKRGVNPPIWQSANSPGGDEANAQHLKRYRHLIKKL